MKKLISEQYIFRSILKEETEEVIEIEQICFPPHEACSPKSMKERIDAAPQLFLVAVDKESGKIAGFLNGISTNETVFRDEFFMDISLYEPEGRSIMLLGLDVRPEYRGQGLATEIMNEYIHKSQEIGKNLLVLTCLDDKVKMYEKMGYQDIGIAGSTWGGEQWHEMSYEL